MVKEFGTFASIKRLRTLPMVITNLEEYLLPALAEAEEVWIAVALITEDGYQRIQGALTSARQHFLIGVDLPTDPSVLRSIQRQLVPGSIEAGLASYAEVFHPKVYIARKADRLTAIVGSANLTGPGLNGNHEISFVITDQHHCKDLIRWFQERFGHSYPFSDSNLSQYEELYNTMPRGPESGAPRPPRPTFTKPTAEVVSLDTIDLSGFYFGKSDYLAFRKAIQQDRSRAANREREAVGSKFEALHHIIFPEFRAYGIDGLDSHGRQPNLVSHAFHADGYTSKSLNAMWLSYGKHRDEIRRYQDAFSERGRNIEDDQDKFSFINHPRLQVRIEEKSLGIWLLFAKNGGSLYDREKFRRKMQDSGFRQEFFDALTSLSNPHWIQVNRERIFVDHFTDPQQLWQHCRQDRIEEYFEIGRDYAINDQALKQSSFPTTVLEEFRRLFPLYQM